MNYRSYWTKLTNGWHLLHNPGHEWPDGEIADVAFWSEALTSDEIDALAKGLRPNRVAPKKLIEWWPLDGIHALKDQSSSGR